MAKKTRFKGHDLVEEDDVIVYARCERHKNRKGGLPGRMVCIR